MRMVAYTMVCLTYQLEDSNEVKQANANKLVKIKETVEGLGLDIGGWTVEPDQDQD